MIGGLDDNLVGLLPVVAQRGLSVHLSTMVLMQAFIQLFCRIDVDRIAGLH